MARGSFDVTGFGVQLDLHHNACLVRLHLSCDFSASVFSCPLCTVVVSRELLFFLLSNECVLKCSEVQYLQQNILE